MINDNTEVAVGATKEIFVRFSRDRSPFSTFIYVVGGGGYTHAAISLGENEDYYTFSLKGFVRERRNQRKNASRDSFNMKIEVAEDVYNIMKDMISYMEANREKYKYSVIGMLLCFYLRLPIKFKNKYFCSQFVAELLRESGGLSTRMLPAMCRPRDLHKALMKHEGIVEINREAGLDPYVMAAIGKVNAKTANALSKMNETTVYISGKVINAWWMYIKFMHKNVVVRTRDFVNSLMFED